VKALFGHYNAIFDDLETGGLPPLHPATSPLPVNDQLFDEGIRTNNDKAAQTA